MIPYGKQHLTPTDFDAVAGALASPHLTAGPLVRKFEDHLCALTGARYATVCSNATAALHLACLALQIKPGEKGLTSPITFLASANCIEFCGGETDFIDIDPESLCLSPGRLKEYCEKNGAPRIVVPVDFAGAPAALPEIYALSRQYGFTVIEDAAHSIGTTYMYNGTEYQAGSCAHADMAVFSFHPVKTVTTGEGGAILTNNPELADRVAKLRSHGIERDPEKMGRCDGPWYHEMQALGFNYRMTEPQCALGISQLARLGEFKTRRQAIATRYREAFAGDKRLRLPPWLKNTSPCFHLFPIQFSEGSNRRLAAYHYLLSREIQTQVHYIPVYWQPYYREKYGYKTGKCPRAEEYYSSCLSLPLFASMTDEEVERVILEVRKALEVTL